MFAIDVSARVTVLLAWCVVHYVSSRGWNSVAVYRAAHSTSWQRETRRS